MAEERPGSSTRGFRVHCYEVDDALVAECHGRLTSENAPALKEEVKEKIGKYKRIILDLKHVPQMDSSGLGTVVALYVSGRTRGTKVEMANADEQVRKVFSIANMLSLFEHAGRHR